MNYNEKWGKRLPVIFIGVVTIVFFYPVIFQGKTYFAFDTLFQYLPWSSWVPNYPVSNPLITDPINNHYLWHQFISDSVGQGQLPLWNPYTFCGMPFATGYTPRGNPVAFFSFLVLQPTSAHDLVLGIHLFLSGMFMFLYLTKIHLSRIPALIGAVSWMFKGYVMVFFEIESTVITAASLPAALYFFERWLKSNNLLDCLGFVCAVAVSISSGYTHLIIFQILFIGAYMVYRYVAVGFSADSDFQRKKLIHLSIAILLGILLTANFVTSHLPFLDDPQRPHIPFKVLHEKTGQLPVKYLTTLLFPDFFGSPASNIVFTPRSTSEQTYNNYSELCIYSGVLSVFFAVTTLFWLFKRNHVPFYLITLLSTLAMAMGSIIYYPLAAYIPGLNLSSPTRTLYIFGFSVSVLTAIGADILYRYEAKKTKALIIGWLAIAAGAVAIVSLVQFDSWIDWAIDPLYRPWLKDHLIRFQNHFSLTSEAILPPLMLTFISFLTVFMTFFAQNKKIKRFFLSIGLLVLSIDLILFGMQYNTATPKELEFPPTEAVLFLKKDRSKFRIVSYGNFFYNGFTPFKIEDAGGYNSFYPRRYGEFLHLCQYGLTRPIPKQFSRWITFRNFRSGLFDLINIKYILVSPHLSVKSRKLKLVYDKEIKIYENLGVLPRVFFVTDFIYADNRKEAVELLSGFSRADFMKTVILEERPPNISTPKDVSISSPVSHTPTIHVISYNANRIDLSVETDQKGFIIISDSFNEGWVAKIDGKEVEVLRANYIMRAVPISKGRHNITLEFKPKLLIYGIYLTALGWILLVLLISACVVYQIKR